MLWRPLRIELLFGICWRMQQTSSSQTLFDNERQVYLMDDNNASKWLGLEGKPYTAKERRILITNWAGEAYKKLCGSEYDHLRTRCFQKTGCLMTADGSEDHLIAPEGLEDFVVPPPNKYIDPSYELAATVGPNCPVTSHEEEDVGSDSEDDEEGLDLPEDPDSITLPQDIPEDRNYQHEHVGKKIRIHYHTGFAMGCIDYFNTRLQKFFVSFHDGSDDLISPDDIDGVEVTLMDRQMRKK